MPQGDNLSPPLCVEIFLDLMFKDEERVELLEHAFWLASHKNHIKVVIYFLNTYLRSSYEMIKRAMETAYNRGHVELYSYLSCQL